MTLVAIGMIAYGLFVTATVIYLSRRRAIREKAIADYQRTGIRSPEYIRLYEEDRT